MFGEKKKQAILYVCMCVCKVKPYHLKHAWINALFKTELINWIINGIIGMMEKFN